MSINQPDHILTVLQLEFEKGRVLVACKGTLRREAPRRGWVWEGVTPSHWGGDWGTSPKKILKYRHLKKPLVGILSRKMCIFYCVKVIDINGLTEIQIYYENETVSTPLWVS